MKKVKRIQLTCLKCNDKIYSKFNGSFAECSCGACFIDQTPHYCRIGGSKADYKTEEIEIDDPYGIHYGHKGE